MPACALGLQTLPYSQRVVVACLCLQDCNLVTYDALGQPIFASSTTAAQENPDVTPPCRLVVSGAGGGFIAIIDSFASGDQSDTVLYTRPLVGDGIMTEGQILPQVLRHSLLSFYNLGSFSAP